MATAEQYAQWIVSNQDKKGSPEFYTVAKAYQVAKGGASPSAPLKQVDVNGPQPETAADAIAANPATRFALGAASPFIGAAQLYANVDPTMRMSGQGEAVNRHLQALEQAKTTGMKAAGTEGFDFMGLAGNVANPLGWAATKALPLAATLPGRMAQGAGFGAATGAVTPVVNGDFAEQKSFQVGAGAALGAALPAVLSALRVIGGTLKDVGDLVLPGGAQRIFEKYQNRILGADEATRKQVIDALRSAEEHVKGSKPTAAEALAKVPQASPLVSYQNIISATPGGPSGAFAQRISDQEAARRAALQTVGKTQEELQQAITDRSKNAGDAYGAIRDKLVSAKSDTQVMEDAIQNRFMSKASALQDQGRFQTFGAQQNSLANNWTPVPGMPRVPGRYAPQAENVQPAATAAQEAGWIAKYRQNEKEFLEQTYENLKSTIGMNGTPLSVYLNRPSMREAVKDAVKSAQETGAYFPSKAGEPFSVGNLQRIKESLDAGIQAAQNAAKAGRRPELSETELLGTRNAFVNWLKNKVPEWNDARIQYAADSRVIDRMKVGQALQDKLVSATGKETPQSFANAVRNEVGTIKKATGQPRYEGLEQLMNPKEVETINSVLADVTRRSAAFNQPQRTNLYGGVNIAEETTPRLPNLLSRPAMIANALVKAGGRKVEQEVDRLGAEAYLNPSKLADIFEKMSAPEKARFYHLLGDTRNPLITGAPIYGASQGQP